MASPIKLFISYSHKDEALREELDDHLANLKRQQLIDAWHDRKIVPGQAWAGQIDEALNAAQVVLLLISARFMASDYCHDKEMLRAMERDKAGEAVVIPIILYECDWTGAPFSGLQALPKNAEPITSDKWTNHDQAWTDVVRGIRRAIEQLRNPPPPPSLSGPTVPPAKPSARESREDAPDKRDLHLCCDRERMRDAFLDTLRTHQQERPQRPMLCLIHRQRFDCHDDFLARLKAEILPSRFDTKINDLHWKQPPAPLSTPEKFWLRFDEDWPKTNTNFTEKGRARIQAELAKLNGPLFVRLQWHSGDFDRAQTNGLLNFLKFWQDWPDLPAQTPVICALALIYAEPNAAKSAAARWAFWRKANPAPDPLGEWVAQLAAPQQQVFPPLNFTLKVLERLPLVEYQEVARWCSDDEVKRVRDLTDEVIEIFKHTQDQPIEMHALTKVLKRLLAGEPLSPELLALIPKRS